MTDAVALHFKHRKVQEGVYEVRIEALLFSAEEAELFEAWARRQLGERQINLQDSGHN